MMAEIQDKARTAPVKPVGRISDRGGQSNHPEHAHHRPGIVTTIAISHLIMAFMFFAVFVVGILLQVRGLLESIFVSTEPDTFALSGELYTEIDKGMPGHRVLLGVDTALCLAFTLLLVISAFGLLKMRRWGRTLSLIFSGAALARGLVAMLYALVF